MVLDHWEFIDGVYDSLEEMTWEEYRDKFLKDKTLTFEEALELEEIEFEDFD